MTMILLVSDMSLSLEELYIGLLVCSVSINAHIHVFEYKPIWFKASD